MSVKNLEVENGLTVSKFRTKSLQMLKNNVNHKNKRKKDEKLCIIEILFIA